MENQNRFNLNAALQTWREELAAQPNLTAEARRELETHVRDTVAEMQQRGLNDEESFWLARRRVGQPNELGAEFAKADPANARREWVLWIALAFFAMYLWRNIADLLCLVLIPRELNGPFSIQVASSLKGLLVALLGVYVARSRSMTKFITWRSFIRSHGRVLVVCSFLAVKGFEIATLMLLQGGRVVSNASDTSWALSLIAIILWLLSSEKSRTLQHV